MSRTTPLVALIVAVLSLAGCKTSGLDVATALRDRIKAQGLPVTSVRCDREGTVRKGAQLTCTADLGGTPVPYDVTLDGDRSFQAAPTVALIAKADLEARLVEQTRQATGLTATVACGPAAVQTAATLSRAGCAATVDGTTVGLVITPADGDRFASSFAQPVLVVDQAERSLAQQVTSQSGRQATVDCGAAALVVVPGGGSTTCTYRLDDGRTGSLAVVVDAAGLPSVAAPATGAP